MFEILSKNIPKNKRNKFPAHILPSHNRFINHLKINVVQHSEGCWDGWLVWLFDSLCCLWFLRFFMASVNTIKSPVSASTVCVYANQQTHWMEMFSFRWEIKIKFENSICKFCCGLLSIAISISVIWLAIFT